MKITRVSMKIARIAKSKCKLVIFSQLDSRELLVQNHALNHLIFLQAKKTFDDAKIRVELKKQYEKRKPACRFVSWKT